MSRSIMTLHTWSTPNGRKASIMLEETSLPYHVVPVNLGDRAQFEADFLSLNGHGKIPVLEDPNGPNGLPIIISESTAILIYLAEKSGILLPDSGRERVETLEWLTIQTSGLGPLCGQAQAFRRFLPELNQAAITHFSREVYRLYNLLENRLAKVPFLAGDAYSIADIATWPWIARANWYGMDIASFPRIGQWFDKIEQRPAVRRGFLVPGGDELVAEQLKR